MDYKEQRIQNLLDAFESMDWEEERKKWNCVIRWYEWGYVYEIFYNNEMVDMSRSKREAYEKLFDLINAKNYSEYLEQSKMPF